jgi:hypothetical protein
MAVISPNMLVNSLGWNATVAGYGLVGTAIIVLIALAISFAGAVAVALSSRVQTPVEALRPAGKVRAR